MRARAIEDRPTCLEVSRAAELVVEVLELVLRLGVGLPLLTGHLA
jgi:hypothetical protein